METQATFETKLAYVEQIAQELENGQLGLEDALNKYEKAMQQLQALEKELTGARQRLTMIRKSAAGEELTEVPVRENERGVELDMNQR